MQYKEYAIHLDHQLKDASGKSAEYVAKHHAYADALGAFGDAAAAMSKFESGPAANAFVELQKTTKAVSDLSIDQNGHLARCGGGHALCAHVGNSNTRDDLLCSRRNAPDERPAHLPSLCATP